MAARSARTRPTWSPGRSLQSLLGDLPDDQRAVFVACVLEERTTAEVANELGIAQDLVRWRLRTARSRLRDRIDPASI